MPEQFKQLTWQQVRTQVHSVNPSLASVIDALSPSDKFTFIKADYPFGSEILSHVQFNLPGNNGNLTPFNGLKPGLQKALGYNYQTNPVSLVLKNSVELFIKLDNRIIPFALIQPGRLFGLWRILDSQYSHCPLIFVWGITAGARSMFMLPKISDGICHNRLKNHFNLHAGKPGHMQDHWQIFREITHSMQPDSPWNSELLFFSKEWFEHLDDPAWANFHRYLLRSAWENNSFWRNQFIWKLIFTSIETRRQLKPNPYIADLTQQAFMVSVGALPGFAPATDESAGPVQTIQAAYREFYQLKHYPPIVMQPKFFSQSETTQQPVYLSLQYPSAIELAPRLSTRTHAIADLEAIQMLTKEYIDGLLAEDFRIGDTPLAKVPFKVQFDHFHRAPINYPDIYESKQISQADKNFHEVNSPHHGEFPANSSFFNGCIRISNKNNHHTNDA